jgi:hypothetical protein
LDTGWVQQLQPLPPARVVCPAAGYLYLTQRQIREVGAMLQQNVKPPVINRMFTEVNQCQVGALL